MAAINFPDNPTTGQIYETDFGYAFQWDGTVWKNYYKPGVYTEIFKLENDNNPVLGGPLNASGLNISNAGIITATRYYGDGSFLTGVSASGGGGGAVEVSNITASGGTTSNVIAEASALRFKTADFTVTDLSGGEILIESTGSGGFSSIEGVSSSSYSTIDFVGAGVSISTSNNNVTFYASLDTLSDTQNIANAVNNQVLKYNSILGKWVPSTDQTGDAAPGGEVNPDDYVQAAGYSHTPGYWTPGTGAVSLPGTAQLSAWLDALNNTLGLLAPSPPPTIADANSVYGGNAITLTGITQQYNLCSGFTPTDNTGGLITPSAGTAYKWNKTSTASSNTFSNRGPADSGTIKAYVNTTIVGSYDLTAGVDNGTYDETGSSASGGIKIASDRDASAYYNDAANPAKSVNGKSIPPGFFNIMDVNIQAIPSSKMPGGFNHLDMIHTVSGVDYQVTGQANTVWYQDDSNPGSPTVAAGTVTLPSAFTPAYSSGIPHLPVGAAFDYDITLGALTGDFYKSGNPVSVSSSDVFDAASKTWNDVAGTGTPPQNFPNGTTTTSVSQTIKSGKFSVVSSNHFGAISVTTPYGSSTSVRATISDTLLVFSGAEGSKPNETSLKNALGATTIRTGAGSGVDNPAPTQTAWVAANPLADYEASIIGGLLSHDLNNYATGYFPTGGQDYSGGGRSGTQYVQFSFNKAALGALAFKVKCSGTWSGFWLCLPQNTIWMSGTSFVNGWADLTVEYAGAGIPGGNGSPGCAKAGNPLTTGSNKTCQINLGTGNTTGPWGVSDILLRVALNPGENITALEILS